MKIEKSLIIILTIVLIIVLFFSWFCYEASKVHEYVDDNQNNVSYDINNDTEKLNENIVNNQTSKDTKNYDKNLKVAYIDENDKENSKFIYSTESVNASYDWKDYIVVNKTILNEMPEIDFSKFKELDNEFYSLKITNYEQYKEYATNYNLKQLEASDFDNIFVEIIIRKNADNSIRYSDIIKGYEYIGNKENYTFPVEIGGFLDVTKEFKYPCIVAYFPNYMNENYDDFHFKVIVKENDIKIPKEVALKTAQNYLSKLNYKGYDDFSYMDYVRITKEYSNNFLSTSDKENPINNTDKKYTVWSISAYSNDDPCTWANVYIDVNTGKIIGGILNFATD